VTVTLLLKIIGEISMDGKTVVVRCGKCGDIDDTEGKNIFIDFKNQEIYYVCGKCKKDNTLKLEAVKKPLPKIRRG
jgi:hypothetical protein